MTLLEIAIWLDGPNQRGDLDPQALLRDLETNEAFCIIPLTPEIALDVAEVGAALRDPADRAIVSTARVHGLKLVTSDQRIIESRLVRTIE